jgi:hypothetical protein
MSIATQINIERILSPFFKENKDFLIFYKIMQGWESFVDQSFVNITQPLKFEKTHKGEGVLFVAVPNSSVSSQFYYSKAKTLSSICLHLGHNIVSDIKTISKPSYEWPKAQNFSGDLIKEVELQEKFIKLASSIRESF